MNNRKQISHKASVSCFHRPVCCSLPLLPIMFTFFSEYVSSITSLPHPQNFVRFPFSLNCEKYCYFSMEYLRINYSNNQIILLQVTHVKLLILVNSEGLSYFQQKYKSRSTRNLNLKFQICLSFPYVHELLYIFNFSINGSYTDSAIKDYFSLLLDRCL